MDVSTKLRDYFKLAVSGILGIWLFIKSPFNPLYEEFNYAEKNFVYYSFVIWFFFAILLLWVMYFVNRNNYKKHISKILVIASAVYFSFLIPYGFDTTDTGFHISKQWFMFHGLWKENLDVIAGTNFFGGLWLLIPGKPLLIWARLGFVVVHVGIIFSSYKILTLYFEPLKTAVLVLVLSIFISPWNYYFTINYDNLPLLFMTVSAFLLLRSFQKRDNSQSVYVYLSGLISFAAVVSKITVIPVVLLFLYLMILENSIKKESWNKNLMSYLYGFFTGIIIFALTLLLTGSLSHYFNSYLTVLKDFTAEKSAAERAASLHDHSFFTLYRNYTSVAMHIISNTFTTLFVLLLSGYVYFRSGSMKPVVKYLVYLFTGWILYYRLFGVSTENAKMLVEIFIISVLSFVLSLMVIWVAASDNSRIKIFITPLIAVAAIFIFSFIGSDLGFSTAFRCGASVLLISFATLLTGNAELNILNYKMKYGFIYYFIITAFFIGFMNSKYTFYRDLEYSELKTDLRTPALFGIRTNRARAIVVNELFDYLSSVENIENKKVFFTHNNAMMYYLANVKYPLKTPWDVINDLGYMKEDFSREKPDIIVLAKSTHQDVTWPYSDNTMANKKYLPYYDFYDQFIVENDYAETYSNYFYKVYERK